MISPNAYHLSRIPYYYYLIDGIERSVRILEQGFAGFPVPRVKTTDFRMSGKLITGMHARYPVPFLEMCAIGAGIAGLIILAAAGFLATLPVGHMDALVRQNIRNSSLFSIAWLAIGAFCGSIILYLWFLR